MIKPYLRVVEEIAEGQKINPPPLADSGNGGNISGMSDRIARLEGMFEGFKSTVDGLRHGQNLMLGIVSLLAVVLIGLSVYELQRLDQLNDHIAEIPRQVSGDLQSFTKTISATITASKQQQPQVILLPQPQKGKPKQP